MSLHKPVAHALLAQGTILEDRFEIDEFLGGGSFGEVYRAKQIVFGHAIRRVALKLFRAEALTSLNTLDVFQDALLLVGLQEENPDTAVRRHLIEVYDMGILKTPAPRAFMSMKLVPGRETLEHAVHRHGRGGGMPLSLALNYLRQMLIPLAWMHTLDPPVVHGDLKPDNILLAPGGNLVLTDFGLAARMPLVALGGAIQYQAPEQLLRLGGNPAADMYAVGIIWYEMLTGKSPFADVGLEAKAAGDQEAYIRAHQQARKWAIRSRGTDVCDVVAPPSEKNAELREHPQIEAMLCRCLRYRQSERYANARLLLDHVAAYLGNDKISDAAWIMNTGQEPTDEEVGAELHGRGREGQLADVEALLTNGQPARAYEKITAFVQTAPDDLCAQLLKVKVLARLGKVVEAQAALDRVKDRVPKRDLLETQAVILEAAGKEKLAGELRRRAGAMGSGSRQGPAPTENRP
jgi:serine/threonine protein kinase